MPSPEFQNFVAMMQAQRTGAIPTIPELRVGFDAIGQLFPGPADVRIEPVDAAGVAAEWVTPPDAVRGRTVFYLHGGGYCIGSPLTHHNLAGNLALASKSRVLLVDYRLAPEHPFPAAVDDAVAAWRWLLSTGADPKRTAIGGDSAGGGLTIATLVALRDAGDPLPAAAAAISPWCDLVSTGEVIEAALATDYLTPDALGVFIESYMNGQDAKTPLASPINADLGGLPPLLVYAGEHEVLLDMCRRLASRAKDAGVDVTLHVAPGMVHVPQIFAGAFPEADEGIEIVASFVRDRLG